MTQRYVLAEYEASPGTDTFHIADLIQKEKGMQAEVELVDSGLIVFLTTRSLEEVQQIVWKHNNGLWCETKEIDEEQYDALC